jgi:hypothetical protein
MAIYVEFEGIESLKNIKLAIISVVYIIRLFNRLHKISKVDPKLLKKSRLADYFQLYYCRSLFSGLEGQFPQKSLKSVVSRIRTTLIQSVDMERSDKWPFGTNLVVVEKVP